MRHARCFRKRGAALCAADGEACGITPRRGGGETGCDGMRRPCGKGAALPTARGRGCDVLHVGGNQLRHNALRMVEYVMLRAAKLGRGAALCTAHGGDM